MRKMKKLFKTIFLIFAITLIFGGQNVYAKKVVAKVKHDHQSKSLIVSYEGKVLFTSPYKTKTVYAKKDLGYLRKGPGNRYSKSSSVKKDQGDKMVRVGFSPKKNWTIIRYHDNYYFVPTKYVSTKKVSTYKTKTVYTSSQLKRRGVIYWGGWRWTWYSQKVMPGRGLRIPGRHVAGRYVVDKYGYICLASSRLKKGTIVNTPFGRKGRVYDTGCPRNTLDVYTNF